MTLDRNALRACPFCEGRNLTVEDNNDLSHLHFWVACDDCDSEGPWRTSDDGAIEAWNRRAALPEPVPAEVEGLCKKMRALVEENGRLKRALEPSAETKAAYMGEFSVPWPETDEDGSEYIRRINVPWTTIKEIMAAISRRTLAEGEG